jgi:hypothetical protein
VIEESLRRDLGLNDLTEIWAMVTPAAEEEGMNKRRGSRGRAAKPTA